MYDEIVTTYFATSLGNFIFDAFLNTQHESTLTMTKHPIQTGASITDHAYMEPQSVTFEIGMSDVMQDISSSAIVNFASIGTSTRSINAYSKLRQLQSERIPIDAITKLWTYKNMLITSIATQDDNTTAYALKATVTLEELFVATVTTVKISARAQKTDTTNEGDQKAQEANGSIASSLLS